MKEVLIQLLEVLDTLPADKVHITIKCTAENMPILSPQDSNVKQIVSPHPGGYISIHFSE